MHQYCIPWPSRNRENASELGTADRALTAGHSVLFTTLADLAQPWRALLIPACCASACDATSRPSLLVIDEVGYTRLSPEQADHFFELVVCSL